MSCRIQRTHSKLQRKINFILIKVEKIFFFFLFFAMENGAVLTSNFLFFWLAFALSETHGEYEMRTNFIIVLYGVMVYINYILYTSMKVMLWENCAEEKKHTPRMYTKCMNIEQSAIITCFLKYC